MSRYHGFPSKSEYEKYYSSPLPQWGLDVMEAYAKEANEERESFKMSNTKACNLTEDEIQSLIGTLAHKLHYDGTRDEAIERINYLNKRLKAFGEVEVKPATPPAPLGWGTSA